MPSARQPKKSQKIAIDPERPHLILCEGADAYYFLMWWLDSLKKNEEIFARFCLYDFGGINDLKPYLHNLAIASNFAEKIKSVLILRDAETDSLAATQSIQTALKENGFTVPKHSGAPARDESVQYPYIATGFTLFPDCNAEPGNGTLEDLCLKLLPQDNAQNVLKIADEAISKSVNSPFRFTHPHKNRLHAYFSLTNKFVSLKIGEAAKAGAFTFQGTEMDSLKALLQVMAHS